MKYYILSILMIISNLTLSSQKDKTTYIFGHSLINHEFQVNPTPSQETSIPHWLHFLSLESNHTFKVSGQYGFLPQHTNLPPIAQWGFDQVEGAWESDYEPFSEADFNSIIITPGNFIQWQAPSENYPMENLSPLSATETIFNWCNTQEQDLEFYIYENWPDMAPFLNSGFPPTEEEWATYNQYLNTDFRNWFLEYHNTLIEAIPNSCIKMIPVGTLISKLLSQSPYSDIPIQELYEDDAPHGRTSIYFLASMITYMAMYEEKAPLDFQVDPLIHPILAQNYNNIADIFWNDLVEYNLNNGDSRVFCNQPILSSVNESQDVINLILTPNPTSRNLVIQCNKAIHSIDILDLFGRVKLSEITFGQVTNTISVEHLTPGTYFILGKDALNNKIIVEKFIKQ